MEYDMLITDADLDGIDFFLIGSGGEVSYNLEVTSKGTLVMQIFHCQLSLMLL